MEEILKLLSLVASKTKIITITMRILQIRIVHQKLKLLWISQAKNLQDYLLECLAKKTNLNYRLSSNNKWLCSGKIRTEAKEEWCLEKASNLLTKKL